MSSLGEEVKDWLISIVVAVVLAFLIRQFVVELYIVDGPSMRPTLQSQQRLVVNKFIYRFRAPEKGEILVFQYPRDPSRDFIKRVIGVPGDTVRIISWRRPAGTTPSPLCLRARCSSWVTTATTPRTAALQMWASCPAPSSRARPCWCSGP